MENENTVIVEKEVTIEEILEEVKAKVPRATIEMLEERILKCVSKEYFDDVKDFEQQNGRFRKETKKVNSKIITKCKHKIGFSEDLEEEMIYH